MYKDILLPLFTIHGYKTINREIKNDILMQVLKRYMLYQDHLTSTMVEDGHIKTGQVTDLVCRNPWFNSESKIEHK